MAGRRDHRPHLRGARGRHPACRHPGHHCALHHPALHHGRREPLPRRADHAARPGRASLARAPPARRGDPRRDQRGGGIVLIARRVRGVGAVQHLDPGPLPPHRPRPRDARRGRERAGVAGAGARHRPDGDPGPAAGQRPGGARRRAVRAVPGLRQRVDGHRDDRVRAGLPGAGRGSARPRDPAAADHGHAVRHHRLPAAGGAGAGGRPSGRRAQALDRRLRARRAGDPRRRRAASAPPRGAVVRP